VWGKLEKCEFSGEFFGVKLQAGGALELRPIRQMDKFCGSHCCTSDVHFGQGRVGADNTCASRSSLMCLFSFLLTPFTSVMRLLIFPNFVHVLHAPQTDPDSADRPNGGHREFSLTDPTIKRVPADINQFCDFDRGVGWHFYNRIGLYGLSSPKSIDRQARLALSKSISCPSMARQSVPSLDR
jgi:hypothetical protein